MSNLINNSRVEKIRAALSEAFMPSLLTVTDDSHLHAGHAGARSGKGHFSVHIVSEIFSGQSLIARHRAVYAALGELMSNDIHALAINAKTPSES